MQVPRLHPDTIEQVKQRVDIVDVISDRVVLRKRGKDFVGLCPFHDEKSPSFTVSPQKQMYYCFGCQAGGSAINFLMQVEKQSFSDVVLELARRYAVPVQTLEPEQRQELQRQITLREQLYQILAVTAAFYQHALRQSQGQQALEYLKSQRQLSEETIQQFQLGYAPAGWETLYRYLVEQKGYALHLVEQAGLIKPRKEGGGYYDVFRDRLIIPICDMQGKVIAFGGRTLTNEQPKYLNSPETQLFNKGKTLFALDKAKDAIAKQDRAILVEGYFDAIALHAAGITNAVASLGTALNIDRIRHLLRYTDSKQLVLNFDADKAGTTAAERAIGEIADLAYRGEVQLRILNIPDGKDADEYLKTHSHEEYRQLVTNAPLWLDWQIEQIVAGKNLKQADRYQQAYQQMIKLLNNIVNPDMRTHYITRCAEILSQGEARLVSMIAQNIIVELRNPRRSGPIGIVPRRPQAAKPVSTLPEGKRLEQAEALLLRLYLHCPYQRQAIADILEERDLEFSLSHHRFLWAQILEIQETSPQLELDLISKLQDKRLEFPDEMTQVGHLFLLDELSQLDITRAAELIRAAVTRMEQVMCEKQSRYFRELWEKINIAIERERGEQYSQEYRSTTQRSIELDRLCQVSFSDLVDI
ncbi:DNA primase [Planktothrix sp. FACHB-1355]|uniref:DNA primase n=1 Tax=Aerosakkonema funiforme FACHB-1375 TaxID=2949571 RepID=A0A926VCP8_9CYAN|nr:MULTISPECIES: DNA primase [Oscillatoriales]MBD2181300.1 DNA primase [Aerosakkonema funiforme FACHB-1375]MBD3562001.1 DNA primase [Planktothrix sp. FACHB-1355]